MTEHLERARWRQLRDLLDANTPPGWEQVRAVRFDGPLAGPDLIGRLADAGALNGITRIELADGATSPATVARVVRLPSLTALRLEGATDDLNAVPPTRLERLELIGCAAGACTPLIETAAELRHAQILGPTGDGPKVRGILATLRARSLASLALEYVAFGGDGDLDAVLDGSRDTLEQLQLTCVAGVTSHATVFRADWARLHTLVCAGQTLDQVSGPLPKTLRQLSLPGCRIGTFAPEPSAALDGLQLHQTLLPPGSLDFLLDEPARWRRLGLSGGQRRPAILSRLTADPRCALERLELSLGLDAGKLFGGRWETGTELPRLDHLLHLKTEGWDLSAELMGAMLRGTVAPALRSLHCEPLPWEIPRALSPRLEQLGVSGPGEVILREPEQPLALTALSVRCERLEGDIAGFLSRCPQLQQLTLAMNDAPERSALYPGLHAVAPRLQALSIHVFGTGGDQHEPFPGGFRPAEMPELRRLELDDDALDIDSFEHLIDRRITPRLQELRFGDYAREDDRPWRAIADTASADLSLVSGHSEARRDEFTRLLRESRLSHARVFVQGY